MERRAKAQAYTKSRGSWPIRPHAPAPASAGLATRHKPRRPFGRSPACGGRRSRSMGFGI